MEIELISDIQLTFTISSFSCCHAFEQVNLGKRKRSMNNNYRLEEVINPLE